jgi:hypothetical protein
MTVSFPAHVALFNELLTRYQAIVEQIESRLLNVQGREPSRNRSRDYLGRQLDQSGTMNRRTVVDRRAAAAPASRRRCPDW